MEPPGVGLPADPFVIGTNFAVRAGEDPVHDIIQTASKEVQVSKVIQYIKGERQKNMAQWRCCVIR